ncbi:MAG: thiamine pyrophosphate-dependent enzyme, partial [candidate division Zixibacteria bacterium]|nr:thiamine pyrophosphate-dependent enzyme [candidate division Zixibacteria bacterium]
HSAARGENITIIFINNAIFGMTGGQMAPTTLIGQKSTTSPAGRDVKLAGYPIRVCELLSSLDGPAYLVRTSLHNSANVIKTKKAIKRAFQIQMEGKGFSLVEILSQCPTNWGMTPLKSIEHIAENMVPYYPLGEFKTLEDKKTETEKETVKT